MGTATDICLWLSYRDQHMTSPPPCFIKMWVGFVKNQPVPPLHIFYSLKNEVHFSKAQWPKGKYDWTFRCFFPDYSTSQCMGTMVRIHNSACFKRCLVKMSAFEGPPPLPSSSV